MAKKKVVKKKKVSKKKPVRKAVKKKTVKRKSVTRSLVKRKISKPKNMVVKPMTQRQLKSKMPLIIKNLIFFAIFFVLSLVLYMATSIEFYENLFFMSSVVFGFLLIALVISLLIFLILRYSKR